MKRPFLAVLSLLLLLVPPLAAASDQKKPADRAQKERALLGGEHKLTVQWIGWDKPGTAQVKEAEDGGFEVEGEQRDPRTGDFVTVKGRIVEVRDRQFVFDGEVRLRVGYLCDGAEAVRQGKLVFKRTGKRRYWRMADMQSPCDSHVDYVDLYLRK